MSNPDEFSNENTTEWLRLQRGLETDDAEHITLTSEVELPKKIDAHHHAQHSIANQVCEQARILKQCIEHGDRHAIRRALATIGRTLDSLKVYTP